MEKSKIKKTKRTSRAKLKEAEYQESSDEAEPEEMHLNDSSEYSDDGEEEDVEKPWPFKDKTPETNDFVLTELELEECRNVGSKVYYVGKMASMMSHSPKLVSKTFFFPEVEDFTRITADKVKGVLGEPIRAPTKRLARLVKFKIPLKDFNMK